jgi:hypothetical protein
LTLGGDYNRKVNDESKYTKLIKYYHDNTRAKNNESSVCESPLVKHAMKIIRCIEKLSEEKFIRVAWYYYNTNEIKSKYDLFPHLDTALGQSLVLKNVHVVNQGNVCVVNSPFNRYLVVKEMVDRKEKSVKCMLEPYGINMYSETMDYLEHEFHMFEESSTLSGRIENALNQAGTIDDRHKYRHNKILERKTATAYEMRHIWYLVSNAQFFGCQSINDIIKIYILIPCDIEIFKAVHRLTEIDPNSFLSKMVSVTKLQAERYYKIEQYMNEDNNRPIPLNVAIDRYIEEIEDKSYPVIKNHYDLVYERITWQIKQLLPEPYRYLASMIAKTFLKYVFYYEKEKGFLWFE